MATCTIRALAVAGALLGAAAGAGAGIAQSFLAGTGSPVLAATLGVSGAVMGGLLWLKASSTPPPVA